MSYQDKLIQIDALQQKINSYGELSADVKKKINYKFRLDWNYYSNSMEGNTLTMDETRSVMVGNLTVGGKPIKDVLEMKGHDEVIAEILKIGKGEVRLSEKRIKDIHNGIMHEEDAEKKKNIGKWKTEPNYIFNYKNEKFEFAPPAEVPEKMHELLNKTNAAIDAITQHKKDAPHPVTVALQFHLDYVIIHPFYDGNGRTARILTNLLLIAFGYPPFWVKTNERGIYNQYIGDIQGYGGDSSLFFDFTAGLIIRSQQLVLDAVEGKNIDESEDLDKRINIFERELESIDTGDDLQEQFNKEVFLKIYDGWLSALIIGLINKIQKFDKFFAKPSHYINVLTGAIDKINGGRHISLYFDGKSSDKISIKLRSLLSEAMISADTTINIEALYGAFKKGTLKNPFGCRYNVEIIFEFLKYEIYRKKFIPGLDNRAFLGEEMKITLMNNPEIRIAHFDAKGALYGTIEKREDGKLYGKGGGNPEILVSYSREDILEGKVTSIGTERFVEPRLLHKPLTPSEIETLCNEFGNTIFSHIEYHAKSIMNK